MWARSSSTASLPGAKQTQCVGLHDGKPKIQLKAPPVDGAANQALIRFLAEVCAVPKSAIRIELGASGRTKRVDIADLGNGQIAAALAPVQTDSGALRTIAPL